jgi:hypothetical protein
MAAVKRGAGYYTEKTRLALNLLFAAFETVNSIDNGCIINGDAFAGNDVNVGDVEKSPRESPNDTYSNKPIKRLIYALRHVQVPEIGTCPYFGQRLRHPSNDC